MARLKSHYDEAELARILDGASPASLDEVSVTKGGRRLDTPEAVTAFIDGLLREQRSGQAPDVRAVYSPCGPITPP